MKIKKLEKIEIMPKIFIFDIDKEELIIPKISLEINQEEKKFDVKN